MRLNATSKGACVLTVALVAACTSGSKGAGDDGGVADPTATSVDAESSDQTSVDVGVETSNDEASVGTVDQISDPTSSDETGVATDSTGTSPPDTSVVVDPRITRVGDVSYADGETPRDASLSKIHVNDAGTCATFLSGGGWFDEHASTEVIFIDLVTGDAELISAIDGSGASAGGGTGRVAFGVSHPFADRQVLSSDCNKVVFQSSLELTPGVSGKHAYVRNRSESSTKLISAEFQAESSPSISGAGDVFAFAGEGEANFLELFDITIIQVSEPIVVTGGEQQASWFNPNEERLFLNEFDMTSANSVGVAHLTLSADGTHVLLRSSGTASLGLPESNALQLMVGNLVDNTVELATVTPDGAPLSNTNEESSISGDGRYVAYVSTDSHAVAGLPEGLGGQIYLRDLENDTTVLVSKTSDGTPLDRSAKTVEVSDDGHYVIYSTSSGPIYRYEIATDETLTIDPAPVGESLVCSNPGASADGKTIVFYCYGGGQNSYTPEQEMPSDQTAGLYVFRDE